MRKKLKPRKLTGKEQEKKETHERQNVSRREWSALTNTHERQSRMIGRNPLDMSMRKSFSVEEIQWNGREGSRVP